MSKSELFPESDKLANVERHGSNTVVAYDYNGERFCVDCAKEHTEIDRERWRQDPRSVRSGGSVHLCHMHETDMRYRCGNPNCGRRIPETRDEC